MQLTRIEFHGNGRNHGDNDGTLHHVTELDDKHKGDECPKQEILLTDIIECQDENRDKHASKMGPDTMATELLGKVFSAEKVETVGESAVELEHQ